MERRRRLAPVTDLYWTLERTDWAGGRPPVHSTLDERIGHDNLPL